MVWTVLGWICSLDYKFNHGQNISGLKVAILDVNEKRGIVKLRTLNGESIISLATLLRLLKSREYDVVNADIYESTSGAVIIERVYIV